MRQVAWHSYEDNYGDPNRKPDTHWRNWVEVEVFEDAGLRQLSPHGYLPGMQFQLRVPMTDPETGGDCDADGDLALLRIIMVGAELDIYTGQPTAKGFVAKSELAHEKAYRNGDLDGCLEADEMTPDFEYVVEEWQVLR